MNHIKFPIVVVVLFFLIPISGCNYVDLDVKVPVSAVVSLLPIVAEAYDVDGFLLYQVSTLVSVISHWMPPDVSSKSRSPYMGMGVNLINDLNTNNYE